MKAKRIGAALLALCLLLTLTACGDKPADEGTSTTTTTTGPHGDASDPVTPSISPTFGAMPAMAQELAQVYRLGNTVVLFAFITPGMDASIVELVCYDMAADALLGRLDLGETNATIHPVSATTFGVLRGEQKTYTVYDTACRQVSVYPIAFNSLIGTAQVNGSAVLLSDSFSGQYSVYDLTAATLTPVDATVAMPAFTCVGGYGDGFLLHSYSDGLVAVSAEGTKRVIRSSAEGVQVAGSAYTGGVVGDYAVFHSLSGGDGVMTPVRGEGETFCSTYGNGLLSRSQSDLGALFYYDLNRRTVTTQGFTGAVVDAALYGATAVAVIRTAFGEPLTYAYVALAALPAQSMDAALLDGAVVDDLRPLPPLSAAATAIKDTYSIHMISEHDFFDLSAYGYDITPATAQQVADRTQQLEEFFTFFPEGLFAELGQKAPVVIVLCGDVGGTAGGMNTLIDGYNVTFLSVTGTDEYFLSVAAHELGHAIERGVGQAYIDGWVTMQPAEVQAAYHDAYLTVEYTADDKGRTPVWFTDAYGRSSAIEDRATVFEEMYTAWAQGDTSSLDYPGLREKVAYWSRMLRGSFACCEQAVFPWDGWFV